MLPACSFEDRVRPYIVSPGTLGRFCRALLPCLHVPFVTRSPHVNELMMRIQLTLDPNSNPGALGGPGGAPRRAPGARLRPVHARAPLRGLRLWHHRPGAPIANAPLPIAPAGGAALCVTLFVSAQRRCHFRSGSECNCLHAGRGLQRQHCSRGQTKHILTLDLRP